MTFCHVQRIQAISGSPEFHETVEMTFMRNRCGLEMRMTCGNESSSLVIPDLFQSDFGEKIQQGFQRQPDNVCQAPFDSFDEHATGPL